MLMHPEARRGTPPILPTCARTALPNGSMRYHPPTPTYRLVQGLHAVQVQPVHVQDDINGLSLDVLGNLSQSLRGKVRSVWSGEAHFGLYNAGLRMVDKPYP